MPLQFWVARSGRGMLGLQRIVNHIALPGGKKNVAVPEAWGCRCRTRTPCCSSSNLFPAMTHHDYSVIAVMDCLLEQTVGVP